MNQANNNNGDVAVLVGAHRCHGTAIAEHLTQAGHAVVCLDGDAPVADVDARLSGRAAAVLVINTPVSRTGLRFADISDDAFDTAMQDQVFDTVTMIQAMLPAMPAGARIVLVGARGHLGAWGGAHQMAASAAVAALARSLALELAPQGMRVNVVAAGFVDADALHTPASDGIAHAVAYLSDPQLDVSGETFLMDGHAGLRMDESRKPRAAAPDAAAVGGSTGAH